MSKYVPREVRDDVNVSKSSPVLMLFKLLAVIFGTILIFIVSLNFLGGVVAKRITYKQEVSWFRDYFLKKAGSGEGDLSQQQKRLQRMTDELWQPFNSENIPVVASISRHKGLNAFMYPGGILQVTEEAVLKSASEQELAFVVCHELGHFYYRHGIARISSQLGHFAVLTLISLSGIDTSFFAQSSHFMTLSFSRQQETQSDEFALDCMYKKYASVKDADGFFKRLQGSKLDSLNTGILNVLSTHPMTTDRIKHIRQYAKKKGYDQTSED